MRAGPAAALGIAFGAIGTALVMNLVYGAANQDETVARLHAPPLGAPSQPVLPDALSREATGPSTLAPADVAAPGPLASGESALDARVGLLVYGALVEPSGARAHAEFMGVRFVSMTGVERDARPAEDGTYAITGLQPGTWTVVTGLTGYRPTSATLELDASRPVTRFDIVVEPAVRLTVSAFTPDGQPLMETLRDEAGPVHVSWNLRLSALASVEPLGPLRTQFGRGWDHFGVGQFTDRYEAFGRQERQVVALPPGALGWLDLSVPLPVYVTLVMRNAVLASQRVEAGQSEVVFRVALDAVNAAYASLTARFVDALTRAPLEGVALEMSDVQQSGEPKGKSDANGVIHCDKLLPGGLRFDAQLDGYEHLLATVTLAAGQAADLGDVPLSPTTSVSGVVLDEAGHPVVANLSLSAADRSGPVSYDYSSYGWQSKADGSFTIEHLGRRRYVLRLADEERASAPVFVDAQAGDVTGVVLRAETGQPVSVYLAWPPTQQLGMRVHNTDGLSWTDWDAWSGQYVWKKPLPRGRYVAECYEGTNVLQSLPFEVADTPVALTLTGH